VRGSDNIFETSDVPADRVQTGREGNLMKPVLDHRVNKTKWVVLRWPSPAMAQQAGMSTRRSRISTSASARSTTAAMARA
jgi:aminopeptidase